MASLDGKVVMVTGATDGLGRALSIGLAREGAAVLVHGRDPARIADTVAQVRAEAGSGRVRAYQADLAELKQVGALAERVLAGEPRLDVLVNNAGIGSDVPGGAARLESADGYELRFAVNYLAGFALTRLLLPLLKSSAPSRIVNVSSLGQQAVDFDDVMLTRGYSGTRAYCQSKLAQILFTIDLAEELLGQAEADAEHEGGQNRPAPGDGRRSAAVPAAAEGGEAPGQDGDDGEADGEVGEAGPAAVQLLLVTEPGQSLFVRSQLRRFGNLLDDTFSHVRPPFFGDPPGRIRYCGYRATIARTAEA